MPVARHVTPPHVPSVDIQHSAGYLQDLHVYDPATMAWTDLSATTSGTPPFARAYHGFTSAGGKLYVHGGEGDNGEQE